MCPTRAADIIVTEGGCGQGLSLFHTKIETHSPRVLAASHGVKSAIQAGLSLYTVHRHLVVNSKPDVIKAWGPMPSTLLSNSLDKDIKGLVQGGF